MNETTPLPPGQESAFAQWLRANHVQDLDHPDSHYDYRGAFLAGLGRGGETGHFPDTFKQHGHPTFSEESRYSSGRGDGGTWNGEQFIPGNPVTQPAYFPGQKIGYGMTPGVHHNTMSGLDDPQDAAAEDRYGLAKPPPYGMRAGVRHVLPDQIDLDTPEPEKVQLDETPEPGAAPVAAPPAEDKGPIVGWRVRDKDGHVIAELHNVNTQDYQRTQVASVGKALKDQAISPDDHEAASRAEAYGLSLVGIVPASEITKRMVAQYDVDQRNSISKNIQIEKSKRAAMRGTGGPGVGAGPSKADKFDNSVAESDAKLTESIVGNQETAAKLAAINDNETALQQMLAMASSPTALSQRGAVAEYMKTLTGKASTDMERNQILGAAGMVAKLENSLNLWNPEDASLSRRYIDEFKANARTLLAAVKARKEALGKQMADRLTHQPRFAHADEAKRKDLAKYGHGVVTGDYQDDPPGAPPGGYVPLPPDL